MRVESSATSLSWIPSEAVTGVVKTAFTAGVAHYDEPPASSSAARPSECSVIARVVHTRGACSRT